MPGAQGNALDWALALAKAPAERHALRQRPLPDDIVTVMQIAGGGGGEALERAVARTGESPARIVEAARFYLREVLFFPGADAYRTLGVAPDADGSRIRSHHRLLQHWLHPDRCSDEDAVFCARVNAAWDRLRQPQRRADYDRLLAAEEPVGQGRPADAPVRHWSPLAVPVALEAPPQERWRRRLPLLALLLTCVALGVFALRYQQRLDMPAILASVPATEDDDTSLRMPDRKAGVADAPARATRTPPPRGERASAPRVPAADPALVAAAPRRAIDPPAEAVAMAGSRTALASPATDQATARARPPEPPRESTPPPVVAATPRAVAAAPPASTPPPAPAPRTVQAAAPPTLQRVQQAHQVGDRLLAYLVRAGGPSPPIWDSLSAQRAGAELRDGIFRNQDPQLLPAQWRIAATDAALTAGLRYGDGQAGQVHARLVWREQRWLVSDLGMERDW